jgi:hypothetical protein
MRTFVAVSEQLFVIQCLKCTNHEDREFLENIDLVCEISRLFTRDYFSDFLQLLCACVK